jgi:hypothetical protein
LISDINKFQAASVYLRAAKAIGCAWQLLLSGPKD